MNVTIRVEDRNDNVPVFQNTPYSIEVRENAAIGTQVNPSIVYSAIVLSVSETG